MKLKILNIILYPENKNLKPRFIKFEEDKLTEDNKRKIKLSGRINEKLKNIVNEKDKGFYIFVYIDKSERAQYFIIVRRDC